MNFAHQHTYTIKPGSALLFPTLCLPTGTLWLPQCNNHCSGRPWGDDAAAPTTRAENLQRRIDAERKLNDDYVAERNRPPPF